MENEGVAMWFIGNTISVFEIKNYSFRISVHYPKN